MHRGRPHLWCAAVNVEPGSFRRFGPYALIQLSGAGGMGRVDVALTTRPGGLTRLCVLKRMHSELRTPEQEKRFRREASIALRLSHGAIAQTLDVEEIDGELCILQEFVHGTNLAQLENRAAGHEPLPVPLSLHIVREVARGLAYAHAFDGSGIVHRDVTPDNIMLSFSGEVKLVDFGIAKSLGEQTALTEVGHVVGRPIYTAPEVAAGAAASPRSDIYSLGVVLWQLLTGRTFPDPPVRDAPPAPSEANPAVTPEIDSVVACALAPDPAARYQTADELHEALTRLMPAGFVADRTLADFLAAHFPVEAERRMLSEDIARAKSQLATDPATPASMPQDQTPSTSRVPRSRTHPAALAAIVILVVAGVATLAHRLRSTGAPVRTLSPLPAGYQPQPASPAVLADRSPAAPPTPASAVLRGDEAPPASPPRRQRDLPQILRVARVRGCNRTRVSVIPLTCRGKRRRGYERGTSKAPFRSPGTPCGREVGVRPTSCLARCFSPRGVSHLLNRNSPRWRGAVPAMETRLATSRTFAGSWQRANTRELDLSGGSVATARYLAARIPMG